MGVSGKPSGPTWVLGFLRSYTFRMRSPYKMKDFYQKLYVPIRSVQPSRYSCELLYVLIRSVYAPHTFLIQTDRWLSKLIRSYTFCATLAILVNCHTFLYVPYALCLHSQHEVNDPYQELYVPIRSVQPSRNSLKSQYQSNIFFQM